MVLEKSLDSPLDCKEIKPFNPKRNQTWIFIGRADAEALILRPSDAASWLIGKDPDAWKDWRQKEKQEAEDEMVGGYHRLNGHEFGQTPGDSGQGSLACCSPWSFRVRHDLVTEQQYWFLLYSLGWIMWSLWSWAFFSLHLIYLLVLLWEPSNNPQKELLHKLVVKKKIWHHTSILAWFLKLD